MWTGLSKTEVDHLIAFHKAHGTEFQDGQAVLVKPGAQVDGGGRVVESTVGIIFSHYETERYGTLYIVEIERLGVQGNWREYARCGSDFLEAQS